MKVLVTGASGFLGSHVCRRLLAEGHDVRAFRRPGSHSTNLENLKVQYAVGDLSNGESVARAVQGCEAVVHSAALLSYASQQADQLMSVNVDGTRVVADACLSQGARLVNVSSVAAIGIPPRGSAPATEEFKFNLDASGLAYHISKHRAEEVVEASVAKGLSAATVNPGTIFGPNGPRYRGGEMIDKVRAHSVVPYFTGGICAVHVDDVVTGIIALLGKPASRGRYILGGENVTYRDIVERSAKAMNLRRQFVPLPSAVTAVAAAIEEPIARLKHQRPSLSHGTVYCSSRNLFYDSTRARTEFGYDPRGFDEIVKDVLRFANESSSKADAVVAASR